MIISSGLEKIKVVEFVVVLHDHTLEFGGVDPGDIVLHMSETEEIVSG